MKIVNDHLGGMIPFFAEGLKSFTRGNTGLEEEPMTYFKRFYADTVVSGWSPALMCGYRFFKAERMVFATDHPSGPKEGLA